MNSTTEVAAQIAGKLNQSKENSDTKKKGIQHIQVKLGESLKTKSESKIMHGQYIRSMDRQLISEESMFLRPLRGDQKERVNVK